MDWNDTLKIYTFYWNNYGHLLDMIATVFMREFSMKCGAFPIPTEPMKSMMNYAALSIIYLD